MCNVKMCAICYPSGRLCFLHTYAICLSIHPSFKYWLRDRLIGLARCDLLISFILFRACTPTGMDEQGHKVHPTESKMKILVWVITLAVGTGLTGPLLLQS